MAAIYELRRLTRHGIFAVPFRSSRPIKPISLPDGAIVEVLLPAQRADSPRFVAEAFSIAQGGVPATIHHENLGLVIAHLPFAGMFCLPSGEIAAIYGAEPVPIGACNVSVR